MSWLTAACTVSVRSVAYPRLDSFSEPKQLEPNVQSGVKSHRYRGLMNEGLLTSAVAR
jgi:hypothetical protein